MMKRQQWGRYAIALAVLLVGLIWAGVPASTLFFGVLVLACPLMMLFMHGGGHGGHDHAAPERPASAQGHDHHTHETTIRQ